MLKFYCFMTCVLVLLMPMTIMASEDLRPMQLDNGLELYVFQDDTVPLVTFQIVFRTGAIVENEEFNGLSHLYEHMLFKANDKYQSQEEFDLALKEIGCPDWNGGTSTENVMYWSTVPEDQLENIVDFWATTVRTNRIDPAELEKEKSVVINELRMYQGDPQRVFFETINKTVFATYYSRKDVSGSIDVVQNCTPEQLYWLKKTYYVPNNCAVFIAGKVTPDRARAAVEKYFGDWQRTPDPFVTYPVPKHPPIEKIKRVIIPNLPAPNFFIWGLAWRGPDVMDEVDDTYPADILSFLVNRKSGRFMTALEPYLWQKDATDLSYMTQRSGGLIFMNVPLAAHPEASANNDMVATLKKAVFEELAKIASDPTYFSAEDIRWALSHVEAQQIYSNELASQKAQSFSFWWAVTSTEYYQNYVENLTKVTGNDLAVFTREYLEKPHYVEFYWINKDLANSMGLEDIL